MNYLQDTYSNILKTWKFWLKRSTGFWNLVDFIGWLFLISAILISILITPIVVFSGSILSIILPMKLLNWNVKFQAFTTIYSFILPKDICVFIQPTHFVISEDRYCQSGLTAVLMHRNDMRNRIVTSIHARKFIMKWLKSRSKFNKSFVVYQLSDYPDHFQYSIYLSVDIGRYFQQINRRTE